MEQWRQLEDYPSYEVNIGGLVRNIKTGNIIKYRDIHGHPSAAIGPKVARRTITQEWAARAFNTGSIESSKLTREEISARAHAGLKPTQDAKWSATHEKVLAAWEELGSVKLVYERLGCSEHCVHLHLDAAGIFPQKIIDERIAQRREAEEAERIASEAFRDLKGEQLEFFPKTCPTCGRPMPNDGNRKYCCDECVPPKYVAKRDVSHVCVDCGVKYFYRKGDGSTFKRCHICAPIAKKCANKEYKRTHKMPSDVAGSFNGRARKLCKKHGGHYQPLDRDFILNRDGWVCWICHEPLHREYDSHDPLSPTIDHVIALANGGDHSYQNTRACHAICNSEKCAKPVEEVILRA